MAHFIAMDGYGVFIWPCYGLAALIVIWLYWHSHRALKASLRGHKDELL